MISEPAKALKNSATRIPKVAILTEDPRDSAFAIENGSNFMEQIVYLIGFADVSGRTRFEAILDRPVHRVAAGDKDLGRRVARANISLRQRCPPMPGMPMSRSTRSTWLEFSR